MFNFIINLEFHKLGFIIYLISSASFTFLVCNIESKLHYEKTINCFHIKKRLASIYYISFILAILMFTWHNSYCTSYGKLIIKLLIFNYITIFL